MRGAVLHAAGDIRVDDQPMPTVAIRVLLQR